MSNFVKYSLSAVQTCHCLISSYMYLSSSKHSRLQELSFFMLCTGIYTHEHLDAFKSFEGYNFFVSGHVQEVLYQLISCKCGFQFLSAKVIPSQRVNMKPYDVWVCVDGCSCGTVTCAHCKCMAGLGQLCVCCACCSSFVPVSVKHASGTDSSGRG